jgi:hypothetical protein
MAFTLTINTVDGSGWGTEPVSGMNAVWNQAVQDLQNALIPPAGNITLTITRQFLAGPLGQSAPGHDTTGYTQVRAAYLALTPTNSIQSANWTSANIPSTPPTTQLNTFMQGTDNLSIAIGRIASTATSGSLTLGSGFGWDTSSLRGESVSGSGFTAYGVIMHEMTEFLGRGANADSGSATQPMDNFTFSAAGTHSTVQATTRYISVGGGGVTPALYFMNTGGGDAGDALSGSPSFDASTSAQAIISRSSTLPLQAEDWQWMTLIGYNLSATGQIWAGLASGTTTGGFSPALMGAHGR